MVVDYRILMQFFRLIGVHFKKQKNVSKTLKTNSRLLNFLNAKNVQFSELAFFAKNTQYLNSLFTLKNNQVFFAALVSNNFFSSYPRNYLWSISFTISLFEFCIFSRKANNQFDILLRLGFFFNAISFLLPKIKNYAAFPPTNKLLKYNHLFFTSATFRYSDLFFFFFKDSSSKSSLFLLRIYWLYFLNFFV